MKNLVQVGGVLVASVLLANCSGEGPGGCSGIDLNVQPYGPPTNVHLFVRNNSDEPKIVNIDVLDPEGNVTDRSVISAPANGVGEDRSGTYLPQGHEVVIGSCE